MCSIIRIHLKKDDSEHAGVQDLDVPGLTATSHPGNYPTSYSVALCYTVDPFKSPMKLGCFMTHPLVEELGGLSHAEKGSQFMYTAV